MTLKELSIKSDWNNSWKYYNKYYKEYNVDYDTFESLLFKLKNSEIIESELDYLILYKITESDSEWFDVSGYKESEKQDYGISFSPWNELAGLSVRQSEGLNLSNKKLLAHVVNEMSFDGWTEEIIQESYKEIKQIMEDFDKQIPNKERYRTHEEVMAELGLDLED